MRLVLLSVFALFLAVPTGAERKLEFVQAIWRHGDRAPTKHPYPNDIYTEKYWPRGWGELTNVGMNQLYEMGQFFRTRYGSIISKHFDRHQVYFRSSDVNRALVSATSMLAGLYPASGSWEWQDGNTWQPTGVHASIIDEDDLLCRATDIDCNNADNNADATNSADSVDVDKQNGDMYPLMANWTGIKNFGFKDYGHVFNAYREIIHNLTQPEWVLRRWPNHENMTTLEISNILMTRRMVNDFGTHQTGNYYGGFLLNDFVQRALQVANGTQSNPSRFLGYSSHDDNIMGFQGALGVQNGLAPPYACIMIMEIYSNTANGATQFEAELYYRNDSSVPPYKLEFPGCGKPCLVSKLPEIYKDVMIPTRDELYKRCDNDDVQPTTPTSRTGSSVTNGYLSAAISSVMLSYLN